MEEVLGAAQLADEIPAERAVATTISREAIRAALDDEEGPAPLLLEVARRSEDGDAERSTISITWTARDLEALLERAVDGNVTLTFDRAELDGAFADVDAHGLRERALVISVAAAAAFSTAAGVAQARPLMETTGAATASTASYTDVSSGGGYAAPAAATSADAMVSDASSGSGYASAEAASGDRTLTDVSSAGGYTAAEASTADSTLTDASSAGGYTAAAAASADRIVTDVSSGSGYAAPAAAGADAIVTDVSSGGGYPTPQRQDSGSGATIDVPAPSLAASLLAGGAALAIAGAAFAARRSTRPARPA